MNVWSSFEQRKEAKVTTSKIICTNNFHLSLVNKNVQRFGERSVICVYIFCGF